MITKSAFGIWKSESVYVNPGSTAREDQRKRMERGPVPSPENDQTNKLDLWSSIQKMVMSLWLVTTEKFKSEPASMILIIAFRQLTTPRSGLKL
jgi:hypothetical protein